MILTENLRNDTLIRHYSDKGVMLLQVETGIKYSNPVDVIPCRYTYEETDEMIADEELFITGDEFMAKVEEVL